MVHENITVCHLTIYMGQKGQKMCHVICECSLTIKVCEFVSIRIYGQEQFEGNVYKVVNNPDKINIDHQC